MPNVLITGGAGYIASHTNVELATAGYTPIIIDNFSNSSKEAIKRTEQLIGSPLAFYEGDVRDSDLLDTIFNEHDISAVIHFAGLKAVGESVQKPLEYYLCNLDSTLALLDAMDRHNCHTLIFSSSATVYGNPAELPITEQSPIGIGLTNPYGKTKYFIEEILRDTATSNPHWQFTILRYFNPVGAHPSGKIGEDPSGAPNNLLPFVSQVAVGKRKCLQVFGDDYDTPDGTGVRDYIHVVDLARGHVAALAHCKQGVAVYNLGTGRGTSVLQLIHAFEEVNQVSIPYIIAPRRPGDIAACYADAKKAEQELNWHATHTIENAVKDAWNWQSHNPNGYKED